MNETLILQGPVLHQASLWKVAEKEQLCRPLSSQWSAVPNRGAQQRADPGPQVPEALIQGLRAGLAGAWPRPRKSYLAQLPLVSRPVPPA